MHTYKPTLMILTSASLLFLNACATRVNPGYPPEEGGLTVSQIYHASVNDDSLNWKTPHYHLNHAGDYAGYTRTADNETKMLFKSMDNPSIPIFIYPHIALIGDEQLLKPGYTTAFFLYKQNQFALASETY